MKIDNTNIIRLYIATTDNKTVAVATGLKDFVKQMKIIDKEIKSKTFLDNHFKKHEIFYYQNHVTGKKYTFQIIENTKD